MTEVTDGFTPEFKRLKARNPPPDLSNVIDLNFQRKGSNDEQGVCRVSLPPNPLSSQVPLCGIKPCDEWEVYNFEKYPGFMLVLNPFKEGYQRYWSARCIRDLPRDPHNATNISSLGGVRGQDLWTDFVHKCREFKPQLSKQDPLRKLRWTTLGYQYNWTTKEYSESDKADFPEDVACLTGYLAMCLGFDSFISEAAIVNYYHMDSTLAPHTDHSEVDLGAPLFSISFGQPAIFMLGGLEKSCPPMSLMLRSGDVCVMSGGARLRYHAVPKVLHTGNQVTKNSQTVEDSDMNPANRLFTECFKQPPTQDALQLQQHQQPLLQKLQPKSFDKVSSQEKGTTSRLESTPLVSEPFQHNDDTQLNDNSSHVTSSIDSCKMNTFLDSVKKVNENIKCTLAALDFEPFKVYLDSSRINLNIRQVLPPGCASLPDQSESQTYSQPSHSNNDKNVHIDSIREIKKLKKADEIG